MGPDYPDVPGYDPVIQAMCGYMELTGDPDGPPMLTGVPMIDLKAGDEVYANVLLALLERAETGQGQAHRRVDAAGRGLVADHHAAAGRLRLRARARSRAPATSTASSSRPTSIRRATASSTWRSAATCSGGG